MTEKVIRIQTDADVQRLQELANQRGTISAGTTRTLDDAEALANHISQQAGKGRWQMSFSFDLQALLDWLSRHGTE